MIARILTIVGLLLTPVAIVAPTPADAQMEGSLSCAGNDGFRERWRTRSHYGTTNGQEYRNDCQISIRLYYCVSTNPDPESCATTAHFASVVLRPGGKTRIYPTASNVHQYVHQIQCGEDEPLIDWRSKFTDAKGPRCQVPLPPDVSRAPYPPVGIAADPSAPKATLRSPQMLANRVEFPRQLVGTMAEGRTIANIAVSPEGRALGCQVTGSAGFYLMDKATCDIYMRYARFIPAKDASGNPVAGFYEARITWTSP